MLVGKILRGIPDDCKLSSFINMPSPIHDLINDYNKKAFNHEHAELITGEATGKKLKDNIEKLDPEDQLIILQRYANAVEHLDEPMDYSGEVESTDTKSMKHFAYRALIVLISALIILIVAAHLMRTDTPTKDVTLLDTVLTTTKEVIKFIFGFGGK